MSQWKTCCSLESGDEKGRGYWPVKLENDLEAGKGSVDDKLGDYLVLVVSRTVDDKLAHGGDRAKH